jgi:uridine phosphorylase
MKRPKPTVPDPQVLKDTAGDPSKTGLLPHLKLSPDAKVPDVFFLPGDPSRVDLFEEAADSFRRLSAGREFVTGVGCYKGRGFGVCSTGIGGGSMEITVVELARLGVKMMIRTGGCSALQDNIGLGDIVLNTAAVRWGGASINYVPPEFPAAADPFLVMVLADTCRRLGLRCHIGVGATVDSYYEGQGRASLPGRPLSSGESRLRFLREARVLDFDMETETLYTLAYLFGIRAANILAIHGNRATDEWLVDYVPAQKAMVRAALESLAAFG